MVANPNNAANIDTGYTTGSPQLDYRVNFLTTGTYQVWVRGLGAGTADRTVHSGIDGTGPASADRLSGFTGTLGWQKATLDGASATISVTAAGLHTINIWMREDGFQIDKILLTTSASFTPTGAGPAESARGATCTSSANCDDSNPCTSDSCVTGLCQFVPAASGTACATDNNVCTNDVCNAAGACTHPNNTAGCTDDGNVCTNDVCSGGACTHPNNTAACATDNDSCTNDVCSGGVCTHPSNGSCGTAPCTGLCSNPTIYTGPSLQSGNIGTGGGLLPDHREPRGRQLRQLRQPADAVGQWHADDVQQRQLGVAPGQTQRRLLHHDDHRQPALGVHHDLVTSRGE